MLDLNKITRRYFTVKIGNLIIDIEPPKLKVLDKIMNLSKNKAEDDLSSAIILVLNKNKSKRKIEANFIKENLDYDQMEVLLTQYFNWLSKEKNSKN